MNKPQTQYLLNYIKRELKTIKVEIGTDLDTCIETINKLIMIIDLYLNEEI